MKVERDTLLKKQQNRCKPLRKSPKYKKKKRPILGYVCKKYKNCLSQPKTHLNPHVKSQDILINPESMSP